MILSCRNVLTPKPMYFFLGYVLAFWCLSLAEKLNHLSKETWNGESLRINTYLVLDLDPDFVHVGSLHSFSRSKIFPFSLTFYLFLDFWKFLIVGLFLFLTLCHCSAIYPAYERIHQWNGISRKTLTCYKRRISFAERKGTERFFFPLTTSPTYFRSGSPLSFIITSISQMHPHLKIGSFVAPNTYYFYVFISQGVWRRSMVAQETV